ncbi:MAG TPA: hypothetical protein VK655_02595 [Solirubrobacteraceae bacterium]|nr:hypothetical protein [Solirubrobacteraceae bacterium]
MPGATSASAEIVHPFLSSFGSFTEVMGVAVNQSTEDVYVYDAGAQAIYKFNASGEAVEFSSTKSDAISGVGGSGGSEGELAVDSSSGGAKGDIYLSHGGIAGIEIFNEGGEKVGALTEETGVPWGETCGVTVDPAGDVYVGIYEGEINKYVPKGGVVTNGDYTESIGVKAEPCNLAADSATNIFGAIYPTGPVERWTSSQFGTTGAAGTLVDGIGSSLAVDPGNDELYVDGQEQVDQYGPHGEPFEERVSRFADSGAGAIESSYGIAVNGNTHEVYVADGTQVNAFGAGVHTPTVKTGGPTTVTEHTAVATGSVNPEGNALSACVFEYGETGSYGHSVPCAETVGSIGSGETAVPVEAELTGLTHSTGYHYRLVVTNAGGEYDGVAESVETAGPPIIGEQLVTAGTSGEATVVTTIDPAYLLTSYHVEYGTSEGYGHATPETQLSELDSEPHSVSVTLIGLQPSTEYHFRFVATSSGGETKGADQVLSTFAPTAAGLLGDGRGYEQVTPEEKFGTEAYAPWVAVSQYEVETGHEYESNNQTEFTFQAAADGSGLAYVEGTPPVGGNSSKGVNGGNEYLATRLPGGGWSQKVLSPELANYSVFEAFTPDLSTAFVSSRQPLAPDAPGYGEKVPYEQNYDTLYTVRTAGGAYVPLSTAVPPYRPRFSFGTAERTSLIPLEPVAAGGCSSSNCLSLEGTSANYTHLLFAANDALTSASEGRPGAEGGVSETFRHENNLYESVNGQLRLVNVLPDGTTHVDATFGGLEYPKYYEGGIPRFSHAISADGSRIFWTDLSSGRIYMRENGAKTVEISPGGTYQTATDDGSTVYYTNGSEYEYGDLYAYDVGTGQRTDLTPGQTVREVVGTSENGEYIYYLTGSSNLAVWHDGVSKQITAVPILVSGARNAAARAEVTPDGHSIVFMHEELKHYPLREVGVNRVEVYDADTGTLSCASCTSLGKYGYLDLSNHENVYKPRWMSADGSRVFFVSFEGLVPQDTNQEQDVYEWERPGTGGCTQSKGCVYLLSGGTSVGQSSFLDASENGDDVFIVTDANLDGTDEDGADDIYDVRIGAQGPVAQPACTGTGCQGVPPVPPIFAAPPTLTFSGLGNFRAPAPSVAVKKTTTKKAVKCKKGFTRKKNKCVKKKKTKARKASDDRRAKR